MSVETSGPDSPPGSGGRAKGTLVTARLKFLRTHRMTEADEVIATLPPSDQTLLQGMVLPSSWYPAVTVTRLEAAIAAAIASRGDRHACFIAMGRFSAELNLGPQGVRRAYVHKGDPHHVLNCVPRIYSAVYEKGHRSYERTGSDSAIIRGFDTAYSHDHCWATVGWLQRLIELSGGTAVRVN